MGMGQFDAVRLLSRSQAVARIQAVALSNRDWLAYDLGLGERV